MTATTDRARQQSRGVVALDSRLRAEQGRVETFDDNCWKRFVLGLQTNDDRIEHRNVLNAPRRSMACSIIRSSRTSPRPQGMPLRLGRLERILDLLISRSVIAMTISFFVLTGRYTARLRHAPWRRRSFCSDVPLTPDRRSLQRRVQLHGFGRGARDRRRTCGPPWRTSQRRRVAEY